MTSIAAASAPRMAAYQNPTVLLLVTGTLIGFNFPLGKIAGEAGISPMIWAMIISLGASAVLFPVLLAKRRLALPNRRMLRFIVVSGLISFVTPNILLFSVIPHTGAGFTGLMFALSPVFTLTLAVLFKMKTPGRKGLLGIALGLTGAVAVSISRGTGVDAPPLFWILVTTANRHWSLTLFRFPIMHAVFPK